MSPILPSQVAAIISDPTATLCGNFKNTLLRFPSLFYTWFKWAFDTGGSVSNALKREIRYTGDLIFSAAPLAEDASRLLCNGQAIVRTDYPELFTAIGTSYGIGNGTTTFNVPDYRGSFPRGVGGSNAIASTGGAVEIITTLTEAQLPKHAHYVGIDSNASTYLTITSEAGHTFVGGGSTLNWQDSSAGTKALRTSTSGPNTPATQATVTTATLPPFVSCFVYIAT